MTHDVAERGDVRNVRAGRSRISISSYASSAGRYDALIEPGQTAPPEPSDFAPGDAAGSGHAFDEEAYKALEMDALFSTLDTTNSTLGRCALQRALAAPHADADAVRARQEALAEIDESAFLRAHLETLVDVTAEKEEHLLDLMWADFVGMLSFESGGDRPRRGFGYEAFKHTRKLFHRLFVYGESPPQIRSTFLCSLMNDFGRLGESRFYKLLTKGIFTERGPRTRDELPWYVPGYRFRPTLFKPVLLLMLLGLGWLGMQYYSSIHGVSVGEAASFLVIPLYIGIIPMVAMYFLVVGSSEHDGFIRPVGQELRSDPIALGALDAVGEIDLLLALLRYKEHFPTVMCMPNIAETKHHTLNLRDVRNPVFTIEKPDYVGNDIALEKARLSFITGPNSGGKTALCKTVLQCQVLAQMGSFVPATEATFTPADRIFYQVPQPGHLDRAEGRFATELSRTRDIFFGCAPMSLVALDEPFEGTSFKERLTVSKRVLDGFIRLGVTVLFITHNHELAKAYRKKRSAKAQFLMTDFEAEDPTYRFKKGIASHSHAEHVAREIGFAKKDIERRFEKQD